MIEDTWQKVLSPPHGGADRNTSSRVLAESLNGRPLTGVRIETSWIMRASISQTVAPSRGCGSKQPHHLRNALPLLSPPHGGADRNTAFHGPAVARFASPPHGGADRNLAPVPAKHLALVAPSRGCGSKPLATIAQKLGVSSPPHGGADRNPSAHGVQRMGRMSPPHGGADRNASAVVDGGAGGVAPSRGCGSKRVWDRGLAGQPGSPPHGGADRNTQIAGLNVPVGGRPLTGVRIETIMRKTR